MVILNWGLSLWWSFNTGEFGYHNDYFIWGVGTLLLFLPGYLPLSIDGLLLRRRGQSVPPCSSRVVAYRAALIFFGVGLVYFDSAIWKFGDPMWLKGLGFWYPCTLPHTGWSDLSLLFGNEWIARGASYLVLVFETLFLVLLPFRSMRWPLIIVGLVLHVGIIVSLPIPLFGFDVLAVYWLLVPDEFYRRFFKNETAMTSGTFAGQSVARLSFVVLMVTGFLLQLPFSIAGPPLSERCIVRALGRRKAMPVVKAFSNFVAQAGPVTSRLFGVTTHCVFMYDFHFKGYNHLLALREVGTDRWLPLVRPNGRASPSCTGRMWVYFTFRVNSITPSFAALEKGYGRMAEFDCLQRGMDPASARYEVVYQPFPLALEWTPPDRIPKVRLDGWQPAFDLAWNGSKFVMTARTTPSIVPRLLP